MKGFRQRDMTRHGDRAGGARLDVGMTDIAERLYNLSQTISFDSSYSTKIVKGALLEGVAEILRLREKVARLERDWDLRADEIRKAQIARQKLHRAEIKRLKARRAGG